MIGAGVSRIDGPLKVTGRAAYAYERQDAGPALYGVILGAAIGKGRIARLDTLRAERAPGVMLVMTHKNAPEQHGGPGEHFFTARPHPQLTSDRIEYYGEPVALVVADTFERARAAAAMVDVAYEREPGAFSLAESTLDAVKPDKLTVGAPAETRFGDIDRAMADAAVTVDRTYVTPYHFSQPLELHACLASWSGNHLTAYFASQMVSQHREALAATLGIDESDVTVDAAFVGGGFGSKLYLHAEGVLAALAARELGRPVKVCFSRRQVFTLTGHRPQMSHRVRFGAKRDGRLTALGHDVNMQAFHDEPFVEQAASVMRSLYAAPNRLTRHYITNLDVKTAESVRGPGELPGMLVAETAMDELAYALNVDPVQLRLLNDTSVDPELGVPLNGRRLADCLREGARRFGWDRRPLKPASRRENRCLVGYGMAACIRGHFQGKTEARVRANADGTVIVESDMTDIGTGSYTIAAQIAAGAFDVPLGQVIVRLASSDLPKSPGAGGSWGASNMCIAIDRACQGVKRKLYEASGGHPSNDIFVDILHYYPDGLEARGTTEDQGDDPNFKNYSQNTYGAAFAEVAVDMLTGEPRLRRMTCVFAAGRIVNAKTAHSQLMGGTIWGVSAALHEGAYVDPRYGNWVNGDLADYVVPVHADIPDLDVLLLDDFDEHANHLGMKGLGELGVCGTGAAVGNAIFNATGIRIRDFPITFDKLLPHLPPL